MTGHDEKDALVRELQDRSQEVGGHPIGLDAVKGSARRMRRRRNLASGAVAAVVAAVAVPIGLTVNNGLMTAQDPVGPARSSSTPAPDPTEEPTPTPSPAPLDTVRGPLTTEDVPRGEDPQITYLSGRRIIEPDGTVTPVRRVYGTVTPYADGWLASTRAADELAFLAADGTEDRVLPGSQIARNAEASQVAYVTDAETGRHELVIAPTIGAESAKTRIPVPAGSRPFGFVSEDTVVLETPREAVQVVGPNARNRTLPALRHAGGANDVTGLVSGLTELTDFGSCSVVLEAATGEQLFETCDHTLGRFSPDGRYVLGHPAYRSGAGDGQVAILDARTGEVLVDLVNSEATQSMVSTAVWEDNSHVLAAVFEKGSWTVLRIGADRTLSMASEAVPGDESDSPVYFSARP